MLGNCRPVRRIAAAAAAVASMAVASMAVLLAGCGADQGSSGLADSSPTGPQAGSRAEAETPAGA